MTSRRGLRKPIEINMSSCSSSGPPSALLVGHITPLCSAPRALKANRHPPQPDMLISTSLLIVCLFFATSTQLGCGAVDRRPVDPRYATADTCG